MVPVSFATGPSNVNVILKLPEELSVIEAIPPFVGVYAVIVGAIPSRTIPLRVPPSVAERYVQFA